MNKYGLQRRYRTPQGCDVLEIKTLARQGNMFGIMPITHIYLSTASKSVDKHQSA